MPAEFATIYLTNEQLHRFAALACDALVGIQIHTDANADTAATFEAVQIEDTSLQVCGSVNPDGSWYDQT